MGFKDVFVQHPERRYIMFGGGGGVGKTTFSAAAAYWLASQGKKVLVFSVDPQASLTDIFKRDIFGKGPVQIMQNLWAQEIDADKHIRPSSPPPLPSGSRVRDAARCSLRRIPSTA